MVKNNTTEILLPAYNGQLFIREQLNSILVQTDQNWRLILSDDGSTDETPAILQEYADKFPEKCVLYKSGKRFGSPTSHALHLMKKFRADLIFICDQDDFWFPNKVEKIRGMMNDAERQFGNYMPIIVFSDLVPVDAEMNPLADSFTAYQEMYTGSFDYRSLLLQNVVSANSMAVNRAAVDLALSGVEESDILMCDWWLAVVTARFGKIMFIPEALGVYRQHGRNQVGAKHVGSQEYILKNIFRVRDIKEMLKKKKLQAGAFRKYYGEKLAADELEFLKEFEKERSGPFFYWRNRHLIHSKIRLAGMMALG